MFDHTKLAEVLKSYKEDLISTEWWNKEIYKWEAVKWFQDNWDVNAPDFAEMLDRSLAQKYTDNLLTSYNHFPRGMIVQFAKAAPEEVRAMFLNLFDESKDVFERINAFKTFSVELLDKYGNDAKQHYQDENSISTYLWLRYPEKYYIYKFGVVYDNAKALEETHNFKKGAFADNIRGFLAFYNEINSEMKKDAELVGILKSLLTDNCYPDPELKTMTIDVGYYISTVYMKNDVDVFDDTDPALYSDDWFPTLEEYTPGLSKEQWQNLLNNEDIIGPVWGGVLAAFYGYGGSATCTQIAKKYKKTAPSISGMCTQLARRIYKETQCPLSVRDNGKERYWTILFQGKRAGSGTAGAFIWKLRQELYEALAEFGIMRYEWDASVDGVSWYGTDYDPGLSVEDWITLMNNPDVFNTNALEIMKRMKDCGGMASCVYLSQKYGENYNFYNAGSVALARRICKSTGITPNTKDDVVQDWFTVLYIGRNANKNEIGSYIWKLRDNLSEALDKIDLSKINLYASSSSDEEHGYWWLNANPRIWSFTDFPIGETQFYTLYNENGHKRRIFQNFIDAKAGDLIIGYESNPVKKIVALGKVVSEQDGEKIFIEKTEGLSTPIDYASLKECPELANMEYFQSPQGSLFKLTKEEYDFILDIIRDQNPVVVEKAADIYTKKEFLNQVYMTESRYDKMVAVLRNKKNIILQGAPGVGKTYAANRLAWSMMGEKDNSRIEFIQFHQNYSYEDFMMGYKPVDDGFELKYGVFYQFCQKAANQPDKEFFFIIDEINRGNMSKIFGELLMLIEKEYRGTKMTLAYNGMQFAVPENLYIIGMMNTADRSLAMIDYALRRRFSFFEMEPGFDSDGFINYQNKLNNDNFNDLIQKVKALNHDITMDKSLGKGFCIGHSYFCGIKTCTDEILHSIVDYDILPMLSEYWFDNNSSLQKWNNILQGVFQS